MFELILSTKNHYDISVEDQIRLFKTVGFDGFFAEWSNEETINKLCKLSNELGMIFQSVHGPYSGCMDIWKGGAVAAAAADEILECVRVCGRAGVPMVVLHPYYTFDLSYGPNPEGIEQFRRILDEAKLYDLKIAIENVEGEEHMAMIFQELKDYDNLGFCWDTGHEHCYSDLDFIQLYGDRLFGTHLNDNLGRSDKTGRNDSIDDLHLLPFDGDIDWKSIAVRLKSTGFEGPLTFELKKITKFGQWQKPEYLEMSMEQYVKEAFERAVKFREMME
ncbi:MAG: sugar phosphate isomerase/epimerase [Firmicutes bacterium]|nr:sugar phosphate isomerase/epimerase [Bacillota bacterium]